MEMTRRKFFGATASMAIVAGMKAQGQVIGANDRIRVCTIGFHGQGGSHLSDVMATEGAEIAALCDVDSRVLNVGVKRVEKEQGKAPKTYSDMREVMADPDIDAVTIATPNHWHSLAAIWACQAGKDVYVEKPLSHNVWEGRQLVAAAEKHGRVVMHGTQSRSDTTLIRDMKLLQEGFIGKVVHARGVVYKNGNRGAIGHGAPDEVPEFLNYTLWQGPSKDKPFLVNKDGRRKSGLFVHYNWHWFWEYGNGEIGNQGVHEMDIASWAMGDRLPVKIASTGGRYGWDDDGETPNTQATHYTFDDGAMMTFEVRNLGSFEEADAGDCTNSVFCTDGYYVRRKGFFNYKGEPIEVTAERPEGKGKFDHFFNAMRTRKPEDITAPVLPGHVSSVFCHVGNIAYRLGRTLNFDPATETFPGDDEANAHLKREYREGFEVPQIA
jgi:predicted dehydrogenase